MISHRLAVANNPYVKSYDSSQPISYIQYLDANNLDGWVMMQKVSKNNFRFLKGRELAKCDIRTVEDDTWGMALKPI